MAYGLWPMAYTDGLWPILMAYGLWCLPVKGGASGVSALIDSRIVVRVRLYVCAYL